MIRTRYRINRTPSESGLTLVEILTVLIILAIMFAFLAGNLFESGEKARGRLNQLRMQKIKSYLNEFQLMYNSFPSGLEALVSCNEQTGSGCIPITNAEELKDAWGTPFRYQLIDGGRRYRIVSYGADRQQGGDGIEGDQTMDGP